MIRTSLKTKLQVNNINSKVTDFINNWNERGQLGTIDLQIYVTEYNTTEIEMRLSDLLAFKVIDLAEYKRLIQEIEDFKGYIK